VLSPAPQIHSTPVQAKKKKKKKKKSLRETREMSHSTKELPTREEESHMKTSLIRYDEHHHHQRTADRRLRLEQLAR